MLPALQVHLTFLLLFDRCFLTDLSLILVRNQSFWKINVSTYKSVIAILIRIQFYLVFQFYLENLRMKFPPIFHKECVASFGLCDHVRGIIICKDGVALEQQVVVFYCRFSWLNELDLAVSETLLVRVYFLQPPPFSFYRSMTS